MSMVGTDAEETAQALEDRAEFAAAQLMRELDARLTHKEAEVSRLRQVIAHLMTNPLNTREVTHHTSDIDGQTARVDIIDHDDDRTTIRITEQQGD